MAFSPATRYQIEHHPFWIAYDLLTDQQWTDQLDYFNHVYGQEETQHQIDLDRLEVLRNVRDYHMCQPCRCYTSVVRDHLIIVLGRIKQRIPDFMQQTLLQEEIMMTATTWHDD